MAHFFFLVPYVLCRLTCYLGLSGGIQFATAQLPLLELMDCGMSICDPTSEDSNSDETCDFELQKAFNNKLHLMYQKLIIKHCCLKKLSLWGCSGLDVSYFFIKFILFLRVSLSLFMILLC